MRSKLTAECSTTDFNQFTIDRLRIGGRVRKWSRSEVCKYLWVAIKPYKTKRSEKWNDEILGPTVHGTQLCKRLAGMALKVFPG